MSEHKPPRRTRNPELVKRAVLDAAAGAFSERGFAGTSLRDVALRCGISVGLIQYHFGTKAALYEAVRAHAMATYVASQEPQFALPVDDFDTFMLRGLRQYFRFFQDNPEWLRLSSWAALEGDARAWPGEHALMDRLVERLVSAQSSGRLRADIDPELLLLVIGGMMRAWVFFRERYSDRLTHLGDAQAREDAYLGLCVDLLRHASNDACAPMDGEARQ